MGIVAGEEREKENMTKEDKKRGCMREKHNKKKIVFVFEKERHRRRRREPLPSRTWSKSKGPSSEIIILPGPPLPQFNKGFTSIFSLIIKFSIFPFKPFPLFPLLLPQISFHPAFFIASSPFSLLQGNSLPLQTLLGIIHSERGDIELGYVLVVGLGHKLPGNKEILTLSQSLPVWHWPHKDMESKWPPFGLCLWTYILLISLCGIQQSCSLNDEGLALLKFQLRITTDPYRALANWNSNDYDACKCSGVHCGKVNMLDLNGLSLAGTLAPELEKISHFKYLSVCGNTIVVTDDSSSLKTLPPLKNRKLAPWFKTEKASSHGIKENYCNNLSGSDGLEIDPGTLNLVNSARRRLLDEPSSNLAAAPFPGAPVPISSVPTSLSSGAFPAVPVPKQTESPNSPPSSSNSPPKDSHSSNKNGSFPWKIVLIVLCVLILVMIILVLLWIWRKRAVKVIKPWKTGISGQLQKAFVTGVPKLNRAELETACEDFSNIIYELEACTIYKGTLSSGVEIAVVSTCVTSSANWSKSMEMAYRKKLDTLSRINHKNFTNLIGYCDEEQPFTRMMVFEYAPSGTLYEHLNVPEVEHLDWSARMRVIMGTAYCLQYMHHDLNPPIAHSELSSESILLTDDFAAKIAEIIFSKSVVSPTKTTEGESKKSKLPPECCPETDVYRFGLLLLEIITGKLPYQDRRNLAVLADWAAQCLHQKTSDRSIVDPTLQSFKDEELSVIFDVIYECTQSNASLRPTMKEVTLKLRDALKISPDQAVPRLSPLWWAELEILSMEGT
ncbi:hypothetical protein PIB30_007770 [Stylosanthes scabra]|uniref:Protein kinase domain-containing protein n=1 Tax=Stylosanthes scabra TaxID=79078 RepID=A0ABU6Z371_9FABA|nr:hypothetical protein [Stylosanthes scabra]